MGGFSFAYNQTERDMKYRVSMVNGVDHEVTLHGMQHICLPSDDHALVTNGFWWLATACNGSPAGFAGMTVLTDGSGPCGFMNRAGVLPAHRGAGLQMRLIKAREDFARSLGLASLISSTYSNPQSGNNMIKSGFTLFDPKEPWGIEGTNYWRKTLN